MKLRNNPKLKSINNIRTIRNGKICNDMRLGEVWNVKHIGKEATIILTLVY